MRRQQQRQSERARGGVTGSEINIPLPTKGTLTEAGTAEVSGAYAAELTNWESTGASLRLRPGHSISPDGGSASQRIAFEFGGKSEYVEPPNARPGQWVDYATVSNRLVVVNGTEAPRTYDGTTWRAEEFTTDTDLDPSAFDGVIAHHDRLYFWKRGDALDFYTGEIGAIMGPLTRFPLGRLGNIEGSIVALKSLTVDAGHGMNDTLAVFSSAGDVVIYEGLNPSDPDDWRLNSRFKVAPPVSDRAFVRVGSDYWMLTAAGVVSVTDTIRKGALALVGTVSRPIRDALLPQIAEGGEWSMHLSADAMSVIINRVHDGRASQFIYRTDTRSWVTADYPAKDWHNLGLATQFTTPDGRLGTMPVTGARGTEPVTGRLVTGWFRIGRRAGITYLHPTIIGGGPMEVTFWLLSDHDDTALDLAQAKQTVTLHPDNPADPGGRVSLDEIVGLDAVGSAFQLHMEVTAPWAEIVHMKAGVM